MHSITAYFIWQYNWLQSGEPTKLFLLYCTWKSCRAPKAGKPGQLPPSLTVQVWPTLHAQSWSETCTMGRDGVRVWATLRAPVYRPWSALPSHLPAGVCEHACIESQGELIQNQRLSVKSILEVLGVACRGDEQWMQSRKVSETGFLPCRITSLVSPAQTWEHCDFLGAGYSNSFNCFNFSAVADTFTCPTVTLKKNSKIYPLSSYGRRFRKGNNNS